jgi:hypothetical protein
MTKRRAICVDFVANRVGRREKKIGLAHRHPFQPGKIAELILLLSVIAVKGITVSRSGNVRV